MRRSLAYLVAVATSLISLSAFAAVPYSPKFLSEVASLFFEGDEVSSEKVAAFTDSVDTAMEEHISNLTNYYIHSGGDSPDKAAKKARNDSLSLAYSRILQLAEQLRAANGDDAIDIATQMIHLNFAVKSVGQRMDYEEALGWAKGIVKRYVVRYRNNQQAEAYNLYNSQENRFYTQAELASLKAAGGDVSLLNPVGDGKFWTNTNIESMRLNASYLADSPLYKDVTIDFPGDGSDFQFREVKRSESRPKIEVSAVINGVKQKFKLKFLMEMHSETTSAALLSSLGYNTDATRYVRSPKVYFTSPSKGEFYRDLESYYGWWDYKWAIESEGSDEKGDYVIFKEAALEGRNDSLERLGSWPFPRNGNGDFREVRALSVFMAWINNQDMKESEQNRILIKPSDPAGKMYFVNSDVGWSFGNFLFPESIAWFKWNPIKSTGGSGVAFNYLTWHWANLMDNVTYDDARWIVRRIARLSRTQIAEAVRFGRWPEQVGSVLTEKLINRRNKLVEAFGLDNEFPSIGADTSQGPSDDDTVSNTRVPNGRIPGYSQDFGNQIMTELTPILIDFASQQVLEQVDTQVSKPLLRYLTFNGEDAAGLGIPWASGLVLRINRQIIKNREPRNVTERFLVHDQILVGWRFGGTIADTSAQAVYYRSFNLLYPAVNEKRSFFGPKYLANLLLPYAAGVAKLPPKYSLFIEDFVEGKGTIRFRNNAPIDLSASASLARVYLKRMIVSDKGNGLVNLMEDHSQYTDLSAKLQAELVFLPLPMFQGAISFPVIEASARVGQVDWEMWSVPTGEGTSNLRFRDALHSLMFKMDRTKLGEMSKKRRIHSSYLATRASFNLFNILFSTDKYRRDNISEYEGPDDTPTDESLQIVRIAEQAWMAPILKRGERNSVRTFFVGVKDSENDFENPVLGLNIKLADSETLSNELKDQYIGLCNKAALDDAFIPFTPLLHTTKDQWGPLVTQLDLLFYKEAIEKLLATPSNRLWEEFEQRTGIRRSTTRDATRTAVESALIENFGGVVGSLEAAAKTSDRDRRAKHLVSAINNAAVFSSMTSGVKGDLIGILHAVIGDDGLFMSAKIAPPNDKENVFPSGKPLINRLGEQRFKNRTLHDFDLGSFEEIYNFFETIIPTDTLAPSTDYKF